MLASLVEVIFLQTVKYIEVYGIPDVVELLLVNDCSFCILEGWFDRTCTFHFLCFITVHVG